MFLLERFAASYRCLNPDRAFGVKSALKNETSFDSARNNKGDRVIRVIRGQSLALLTIGNQLWCGFARFQPIADFLDLPTEGLYFLLLLRDREP